MLRHSPDRQEDYRTFSGDTGSFSGDTAGDVAGSRHAQAKTLAQQCAEVKAAGRCGEEGMESRCCKECGHCGTCVELSRILESCSRTPEARDHRKLALRTTAIEARP